MIKILKREEIKVDIQVRKELQKMKKLKSEKLVISLLETSPKVSNIKKCDCERNINPIQVKILDSEH